MIFFHATLQQLKGLTNLLLKSIYPSGCEKKFISFKHSYTKNTYKANNTIYNLLYIIFLALMCCDYLTISFTVLLHSKVKGGSEEPLPGSSWQSNWQSGILDDLL